MSTRLELEKAAEIFRNAARESLRKHRVWYLVQATLMVVGGIIAIVLPVTSSIALALMLGWMLVFSGIVQAISLIGASKVPHFWPQLISAILAVVVGVLFLRTPMQGILIISILLIVFLTTEGIAKVTFALTIRPLPNWGWVLASGILGVVLAMILWSTLPTTAAWLLGLLFGAQLFSEGIALGAMALAVGK